MPLTPVVVRRSNVSMKCILATIFLSLMLATRAWAGFDEGGEAYIRLDFEAAMREWVPAAEQGDVRAQIEIGVMYMDGRLVDQD